jgi:hypothetical protein
MHTSGCNHLYNSWWNCLSSTKGTFLRSTRILRACDGNLTSYVRIRILFYHGRRLDMGTKLFWSETYRSPYLSCTPQWAQLIVLRVSERRNKILSIHTKLSGCSTAIPNFGSSKRSKILPYIYQDDKIPRLCCELCHSYHRRGTLLKCSLRILLLIQGRKDTFQTSKCPEVSSCLFWSRGRKDISWGCDSVGPKYRDAF